MSNAIVSAIDHALAVVVRAENSGMSDARGRTIREDLGRLKEQLVDARTRAASGHLDIEWLRETIRWVASWAPSDDITLLSALGRIARAAAGND